MWVNNQRWCLNPFPSQEVTLFCSGHVKAFTIVTKRPYHLGTCNICLIKAYFGLIISNGGNEKIKTKQPLLVERTRPADSNHDFFLYWQKRSEHLYIRLRYHSWLILVLSFKPYFSFGNSFNGKKYQSTQISLRPHYLTYVSIVKRAWLTDMK